MKDYIFLAVGRVGAASKDVIQTIEYCENEEKFEALIRTLNTIESGLVLVFTETKRGADYLENQLHMQVLTLVPAISQSTAWHGMS